MVVVEPRDRCDRCGHMMREHASAALGTICMVGHRELSPRTTGRTRRTTFCPCDGFVYGGAG